MSFALSKIRPPRPREGHLLPRPALEAALCEALNRQAVVLLCAPAGYGKTATLARALEQLPPEQALAWISIDEGDDLHRLLECLMAALEPFDPPWRTAPEGLIAAALRADAEALPAMVDELANTLDACEQPHGVVVLDDLHQLGDAPALRFIELLLGHIGPRWTWVLAARHEPALRLARLRAAGELAEFREDRLGFSAEESLALLTRAGLDAAIASQLHQRTAGWPAGLRLAINGARGGASGAVIDRQAFDFLAAEVLARIDPALRRFLLRTSVLHELDPARAADISGDPRALSWLEEIERLGLFATVVDETLPTLKLHDLFRDALRHRLRVEHPDEWPQLLMRAAAIERDPLRRQSLLLASGDLEQAARMLYRHVTRIHNDHGGVPKLRTLCAQYPPQFVERSAELQHILGVTDWVQLETRSAELHLATADRLFSARGEAAQAQLVRSHRAATLARMGQSARAEQALAALGELPPGGEASFMAQLARALLALERGAVHDVAPAFAALVAMLEESSELHLWLLSTPPTRMTLCPGIASPLARWARGALALVGERPMALRAMAWLVQAWLATWQGRFAEAAEGVDRAEADAQWLGQQVLVRQHVLVLRLLLALARADADAARAIQRQRQAEMPHGHGGWGAWHGLNLDGHVAAAMGDLVALDEVLQRLRTVEGMLADATHARLRPHRLLQACALQLRGQEDDALAIWHRELLQGDPEGASGFDGDMRVRLAAALARRHRLAEAAAALRPLLEGVDAMPGDALFVLPLLHGLAAVSWGSQLSAASQALLQRWALLGSAPAAAPAAEAPSRLTGREAEVLAQMARGASNKIIARTLELSPHTVKRHVANILDKLALSSRAQAAAWWQAHQGH